MAEPIVAVRNLRKSYRGVEVVRGVSLEVQPGEIFGLLGPNGAGKTTTMEMIEGLRAPDSGEIRICGLDAAKDLPRIRERIGVQLQTSQMLSDVTVRELVQTYSMFYERSRPAAEVIADLDLTAKANSIVQSLSGGQRQRVAIALAIVHEPRVVFLDEPTTGLDPQARRGLWDVIRKLRSQGASVILSTHYMEEAQVLCDRVAIMDRGELVVTGSPQDLIDRLDFRAVVTIRGSDLPEPHAALGAVTGVLRVEEEGDEVLLYTGLPSETITGLVARLGERAESVTLRTRAPNLEDVFLSLTGRRVAEP